MAKVLIKDRKVRNSERSTYRRCRQKWWWHYVEKLSHPRPRSALTFGTGVHVAFEPWHRKGRKRGQHPSRAFRKWLKGHPELTDIWDEEEQKHDPLMLGVAMLDGYVERWGTDDHIEFIAPEMAFAIDVYDEEDNFLGTFVGRFDAVARNHKTGRILLWETKTAKTFEEVLINSQYGEQGMTYLWAANLFLKELGVLDADEDIDGIMFDFLKKAMPDDRPTNDEGMALNQNGSVSKRQPGPRYERQELIVKPAALENFERRMRSEMREMEKVRKGKLDLTKNPTRDCRWDCEFKSLCEVHEMGGDWESIIDMEYTTWDPYDEYELEMERAT